MSDEVEVTPLNVIEVDLSYPDPVIEVTIDKTGPRGLDGTTADTQMISSHIGDHVDPHGTLLTQSILSAKKATLGIIDGGAISTSKTIGFTLGSCYKCTATGTLTLTVTSLGVGQRGSVHILSGDPAPNISWVGVGAWLGGPPSFTANKLTVVTLFNDGTRIVGSAGKSL